jgi:hypothetical protein
LQLLKETASPFHIRRDRCRGSFISRQAQLFHELLDQVSWGRYSDCNATERARIDPKWLSMSSLCPESGCGGKQGIKPGPEAVEADSMTTWSEAISFPERFSTNWAIQMLDNVGAALGLFGKSVLKAREFIGETVALSSCFYELELKVCRLFMCRRERHRPRTVPIVVFDLEGFRAECV